MVTVYMLKEVPEIDRQHSRGMRDGSVLGLLSRKPQTDTHEFTNTSPIGDGNLTRSFIDTVHSGVKAL